jgi:hypothetical protein
LVHLKFNVEKLTSDIIIDRLKEGKAKSYQVKQVLLAIERLEVKP